MDANGGAFGDRLRSMASVEGADMSDDFGAMASAVSYADSLERSAPEENYIECAAIWCTFSADRLEITEHEHIEHPEMFE